MTLLLDPRQTTLPSNYKQEIEHLLKQHFSRVVNKDKYQRINIRRKFLLEDATKQFNRDSFDISKLIRVTFIGESAIDTGGPRREFFRLLSIALFSTCNLFEGYPSSVTPSHNVLSLNGQHYKNAGKMITTSIIQGGPAPSCFAAPVADILIYNEVRSVVDLSEIHDMEIREKMNKVML